MKKSWLMALISLLVAVTYAMAFLKVPPTMLPLIKYFGIDMIQAGLLMTVPSIGMIPAAILGGLICSKFGPKKTCYVAFVCAMIGNIMGALVGANFFLFLIARAFDGASFAIGGIGVPAIISMWFTKQKRGFPLGIFALWTSVAMVIMFNTAGQLIEATGTWKTFWWAISGFSVIVIIIFALVVRKPEPGEGAADEEVEIKEVKQVQKFSILQWFKIPYAWMVGGIDLLYTIQYTSFNNYYTTYMQEVIGLDLTTANRLYSIVTTSAIVGTFLIGFLMTKINKDKHAIFLAIVLVPISFFSFMMFKFTTVAVLIPVFVLVGTINQFQKPLCFTLEPNLAPNPAMIGPALAIMSFLNAIAGIVGPMIAGPIIQSSEGNQWGRLPPFQLGVMVLCVILGVVLVREAAKIKKMREAQGSEAVISG
jgi:MFS family permease